MIAAGRLVRLAAGPLGLVAFFLPWTRGVGVLHGVTFSGYELVGYSGHVLGGGPGLEVALVAWAIRLAALAVAVSAAIHTVLAPAWRWHPLYPATGWPVVAVGPATVIVSLVAGGWQPGGIVLCSAGAAFLAPALVSKPAPVRERARPPGARPV